MPPALPLSRAVPEPDAPGAPAVLRWRARWLSRRAAPPLAAAARLFPVLLHASFEQAGLRELAPGVAGLRYRPSWGALARRFGLPPPHRVQRGACAVDAVLARQATDRLELVVLARGGLLPAEYGELEERMEAARRALTAADRPISARLLDPARLARQRGLCHELSAFGALLAGALPPESWRALEAAAEAPLDGDALWALAAAAPTGFVRLALSVMSGGAAPAPLTALSALARRGPARHLADPSIFLCRWAALAGLDGALLEEALAHADPALAARALASSPPARGAAGPVLSTGRRLAIACARGARRHPPLARAARDAWRGAFAAGFPVALLPALRTALERGGPGPVPLRATPSGACFEVRLPDGAPLSRGATAAQARVRALSLAAAALGPERVAGALDRAWLPLAGPLCRPAPRPALLLSLDGPGAPAAPGAPLDPLNRGPDRSLGFDAALAVRVAPGRRPTARELPAGEAVRLLLATASAGVEAQVTAARTEARAAAARLAGIAALLRDPEQGRPVAAEVAGEVLVPVGGRVMRYALRRYLRRPRFVSPDPDAPDLSLSYGSRATQRWRVPGVVEARVSLLDPGRAVVLYGDGDGRQLREEVPLPELEEHLREARLTLLAADRGAVLAMRLSEDLEPVLRRLPPAPRAVEVDVSGAAPFGLALTVGAERFSGPHRWEDAAQAAMSAWPIEQPGRIAVTAVTATLAGEPVRGLLALHVRSVALRRLRAGVDRAFRSYRDSLAGRRAW
ncbi:hypothetical protein [Anaeromyxobacter paludicola]|uniref:Uncharacterized protein n=1 Tax=Anaeromyxobacter paludicola TaxID=2918171 RepID=A0ABM7X844_9BACT|nr:hypothetical protein [Anaeromyxobacter paludicola]BDG08014.1 hypothetical protein AMPC_11270 [Anaeromyxobacter paludicola]